MYFIINITHFVINQINTTLNWSVQKLSQHIEQVKFFKHARKLLSHALWLLLFFIQILDIPKTTFNRLCCCSYFN